MDKEARKRSSDPLQEQLRTHKDLWNQSASKFIAELISFKRAINGRGDARIGLPPSSIKDPLPPQIGTYLHQLADEYNVLIQGAENIIQEQEHYSQNRQQPHNLTQFTDDGLVSEASWWGSRWYAKYFGKMPNRRSRAQIIDTLIDIRKNLVQLEILITTKDELVKAVILTATTMQGNIAALMKFTENLLKENNKILGDHPKVFDEVAPIEEITTTPEYELIPEDWKLLENVKKNYAILKTILKLIERQKNISTSELYSKIDPRPLLKYYKTWGDLSAEKQQEVAQKIQEYKKIYEEFIGLMESWVGPFERLEDLPNKVSVGSDLGRYLRKKLMNLPLLRPRDAGLRIIVVNQISETVKVLDDFLDLLEGEVSLEKIVEGQSRFLKSIAQIYEDMGELFKQNLETLIKIPRAQTYLAQINREKIKLLEHANQNLK